MKLHLIHDIKIFLTNFNWTLFNDLQLMKVVGLGQAAMVSGQGLLSTLKTP
jgi:hypothetical protein